MRIKELREKLGLTQEQLAEKLRVSTLWIDRQELHSSTALPSPVLFDEEELREIASALNCTVGELFDAPEASQKPEPVEMPEWAIVYGKLEDFLKVTPSDAHRTKKRQLYRSAIRPFFVEQDLIGTITVKGLNLSTPLFVAHPKGGASTFIKGEWLEILDEATL